MHGHKILKINSEQSHLKETLSKKLNISKILAQVLLNRGINTTDKAYRFLHAKLEDLLDPYQFSGMGHAVERIRKAARNKEKVLVFSDYDVDGITSLVLLKNVLSDMGIEAEHYLPHRIKEGYGLRKNVVQLAAQRKVTLLITADCGTNSFDEIKQLHNAGVDVIVTDHHEASIPVLPCATSIINPKVKGSGYAHKDLAGVGVAFKLAQALSGKPLAEELDLVALGTISDVVPLLDENRVITKFGLSCLSRTKRVGLKALMKSSRLREGAITTSFVSFILGPRINASGRMDTAEISLELLLSKNPEEADRLAAVIEGHNRQRQKVEGKIFEEALDLIEKEVNFKEHKIIVVAKEAWHEGVLGIVASKLADRFYRPTILISLGQQLCKGSGRSIKNFHLFQALMTCGECLDTFGGHAHAAGLLIHKDKIKDFTHKINALAREKLLLEDLLPSLDVDMELGLGDVDKKTVMELESLEPFGMGNPPPLFFTRNLKVKGQPQTFSRETLKFWVTDGAVVHPAIGFGMASLRESLSKADTVDLVYTPRIDRWQEQEAVILEVQDMFFR